MSDVTKDYERRVLEWYEGLRTRKDNDATPLIAEARMRLWEAHKMLNEAYEIACHMSVPTDALNDLDDLIESIDEAQVDAKCTLDKIDDFVNEEERKLYIGL